ncbi:substance-K receptor [Nematostella vectensis]|uniref:substance-K receptor n=1 Tax=Nematostella vectensis TaxID=45351 RepID=UPI002076F6F8|nr:substance-K receptor [Nematostella vectensis]
MANNSTEGLRNSSAMRFSHIQLISWTIAYSLSDVAIVLGNALALVVFLLGNRYNTSKANYFLINLAVADELVGVISLPLYIYHLVAYIKKGNFFAGREVYYVLYMGVDMLSGFASMLTIVAIALDRFFAVCYPLRHRVTSSNVYFLLLGVLWLFPAAIAIWWVLWVEDHAAFAYFMTVVIVCFMLALSVAHALIIIKVKFRPVRNISRRHAQQERHLMRLLNVVTIAFLLSWLPIHVLDFVYFFFCRTSYCAVYNIINVFYFAKFLQYAGSFVNPLVYYANNKDFRRSLRGLVNKGKNSLASFGITTYSKKYHMSRKNRSSSRDEKCGTHDTNL